jgi:hypothetical protein
MTLLLPVINAGFTLNIAVATKKSDGNPESAKEEVKKLQKKIMTQTRKCTLSLPNTYKTVTILLL